MFFLFLFGFLSYCILFYHTKRNFISFSYYFIWILAIYLVLLFCLINAQKSPTLTLNNEQQPEMQFKKIFNFFFNLSNNCVWLYIKLKSLISPTLRRSDRAHCARAHKEWQEFSSPVLIEIMSDREWAVPGWPAAARTLRQETQADPDGLLAVTAAAFGASLREESLRGRSREEAAGGKPEFVRDAGEFHLLTAFWRKIIILKMIFPRVFEAREACQWACCAPLRPVRVERGWRTNQLRESRSEWSAFGPNLSDRPWPRSRARYRHGTGDQAPPQKSCNCPLQTW